MTQRSLYSENVFSHHVVEKAFNIAGFLCNPPASTANLSKRIFELQNTHPAVTRKVAKHLRATLSPISRNAKTIKHLEGRLFYYYKGDPQGGEQTKLFLRSLATTEDYKQKKNPMIMTVSRSDTCKSEPPKLSIQFEGVEGEKVGDKADGRDVIVDCEQAIRSESHNNENTTVEWIL